MANFLRVQKLSANAIVPKRQTTHAAGYDLYSPISLEIPPGERKTISLDVSIELPPQTYGRIVPRSGLSVKEIDVAAGVVDCDYRGSLGVVLVNNGKTSFIVNKHDRIAQLIVTCIQTPDILEVSELPETERGSGSFGST